MAQFQACVSGDFSQQELEAARRAVVSSLTSGEDSQGLTELYWQAQDAAGLHQKPMELAHLVEQVTAEQVVAVAKKLELDTIYFLKGKEA